MKKLFKGILSVFLAVTMTFTMIGHSVLAAAADGCFQRSITSDECCVYECDGIVISLNVNNKWDGGYNASVKINNTTSDKIDDWCLEMVSKDEISSIWNAKILKTEENKITIMNDGWNQDIAPDSSVEFGFGANNSFSDFPEFRMMPSKEAGVADERYSFEYVVVDDWNEGFNGCIRINNNSDEVIKEWQLSFEFNNEIQNIWNAQIVSHVDNVYVIKGEDYNQNIGSHEKIEIGFTVLGGSAEETAKCISLSEYGLETFDFSIIPFAKEDYYKDNDGDGVPNILEFFFGLDYENKDSNNNGCSDYDAFIAFLRYSLADDSDGDGISDFSEYYYGLDPGKPSTFDDGINDADRELTVTLQGALSDVNEIRPSVTLSTEGKYLDSFRVTKIEDNPLLNATIPGYFCNAYDLSIDDEVNQAILSFDIPESVLNSLDFVPSIYYFNEQTQELEEVEGQFRDGNKICARLNHFSQYLLINKRMLESNLYPIEIVAPSENIYANTALGLVFSLDESGSVSASDFRTMKNAAISLIDGLNEEDSVSVYTFDDTIRQHCSFVAKDDASQVINNLRQHEGMTAIKDAALAAIDEFIDNSPEDVTKILVLLTDGYSNYDRTRLNYKQIAQKAVDNNIVIYTIGVGNVSKADLETLATETEGQYYGIADFSKLSQIFDQVLTDAEVFFDSDNDGISDYHEKKIAQNQMRLSSGAEIPNYSYMDYLNPDSDEDLLEDGQEMEIVATEKGVFVRFYSSPFMPDTDNDGFDDYAEDLMGTSSFDAFDPGTFGYDIQEMSFGIREKSNTHPSENEDGQAGVYGYKGAGMVIPNNLALLAKVPGQVWWEMATEEYWGYIHRQVLEHVYDNAEGVNIEYQVGPGNRCDIIDHGDPKIWEVKPVSYYLNPLKMVLGKTQLARYLALMPGYRNGDYDINSYTFDTRNKMYKVTYVNAGDGMIYYSFEKKMRNPNDKPNHNVGVNKDSDNQDKDKEQPSDKTVPFRMSAKEREDIAAMVARMQELEIPAIVIENPTKKIIIDVGLLLFLCADDAIPGGQADDVFIINKIFDILSRAKVFLRYAF